jgi:hypothetical protein
LQIRSLSHAGNLIPGTKMKKVKSIICDRCSGVILAEWLFSYEPNGILTIRSKKGKILHYCSEECFKKHFNGLKGDILIKTGDHPRQDRKWIPLNSLV